MRVLIVDDSRIMRQIVRRSLAKAGFGDAQVAEAANGREALDHFREQKPDLIL